jgi:histidine triad (HIT) family protein
VRADESCIFCLIVAGKAPAHRVAEDELALAFMDIFPASAGHVLVIPRGHAANVFEIDADSTRAVAALARRIALAQQAELAPDGLAVYQANGAAAGQTVWHYHVHLIPRTTGQGMLFHGRTRADDAELRRAAEALAARLGEIP